MSAPEPASAAPLLDDLDDDEATELAALEVAVAKADANPRSIPHEEVRAWLLRLAEGDFDVPRPIARPPALIQDGKTC
jgi:hypothetical protein